MYKGDIDGEAKPKISFPLLFAFRRGVRGEPQKSKEIFGFAARPKGARPRRFQRDRSVQCSFKPPRTRSVRIQFRSKKVRAKDMITPFLICTPCPLYGVQITGGEGGIRTLDTVLPV